MQSYNGNYNIMKIDFLILLKDKVEYKPKSIKMGIRCISYI